MRTAPIFLAAMILAGPALAQSDPGDLSGRWDLEGYDSRGRAYRGSLTLAASGGAYALSGYRVANGTRTDFHGTALGPAPWSLVRTGRPGSLPFEAPLPRRA